MTPLPGSLEQALGKLQQLARRPATTLDTSSTPVRVPEDLRRPGLDTLLLLPAERAAMGSAQTLLEQDLLAIRRAMLGLVVRGSFAHPARACVLYDEVRSAAAHGEQAPRITSAEVDAFAWDVRCAIREFLRCTRDRGFTRRAEVRNALDRDTRRAEIEASLLAENPRLWGKGARLRAG